MGNAVLFFFEIKRVMGSRASLLDPVRNPWPVSRRSVFFLFLLRREILCIYNQKPATEQQKISVTIVQLLAFCEPHCKTSQHT
jgi:hypothetical protein